MTRWPTFDDVLAYLVEQGKPEMATVAGAMRDEARQCRQAAEISLKAFYDMKMKYEPPPEAPSHRNYLAKPESSD